MSNKIKFLFSVKTGVLLALVAAVALVMAPSVRSRAVANDNGDAAQCPVKTTNPTIGHLYPVSTMTPKPECTDRPLVAAYVNGQFLNNITAQVGDEIEIDSYIHNSAAEGSPSANDVNIHISVDTSAGTSHQITAQANSANAGSVGPESMTITTAAGAALEIVPGSAHIEDYFGNFNPEAGSVQAGAGSVSAHFNELKACFAFAKFVVFKVKVVAKVTPPPQLTCAASAANVDINQPVTFTATGGDGNFSWTGGGNPATGTGQAFTTSYSTAGVKVAVVSSAGMTATCSTNVKAPLPPVSNFDLSVTPQEVCVGSVSTFTVTNATADLRGKQIFWSSTINGVPTGENLAGYGHIVDSNGTWSDVSSIWALSNIGTWTKTASFLDQTGKVIVSKTVSFKVKDCAVPTQLVCVANPSTADVNQPVTFTATGGDGNFSWIGGENPVTGVGQTFVSTFVTPGTRTVTVTSAGKIATCSVFIKTPPVQKGILQITKEVRNITKGTGFASITNAHQGDTLEYRIKVSAGSSIVLTNVTVTDTFASGLDFVSGSLQVDGVPHAPGLTSGGILLPTLGQTPVVITYRATVAAISGSILNTAQATATNSSNSPTAQALVNVIFVQPGQPALTITKQVKNETKNTEFASSINAVKNDVVVYKITVSNSGDGDANNVVVSDSNSAGSPLDGSLVVSKTHTGSLFGGIVLGILKPGETVTITYKLTVGIESGVILNTASVSASNAATRTASATVNVLTSVTPPGNNTVINNSFNNTCVNNSCNNTYFINNFGTTTPVSELRQLSVQKNVRNITGGLSAFSNSVSANVNDIVEFEVIITNTGNRTVNNIRLTDTWSGGLSFIPGSTRVDNSNVGDIWSNFVLFLDSLASGQQKRVIFQAKVTGAAGSSIQNIASVSASDAATVQDDAWVFVRGVEGGNINLIFSKKAFNDTKGADATSVIASKEDFITYTLTVFNSGNAPASNFVITDDLSQVLPYADIVDFGGGTLSGNVISYPGISIPAGGSVSKSFRVRIKFFLSSDLSFVMSNTYGNTVVVRIHTPQVKGIFVAPRTGANTGVFLFASMLTAGFAVARKGKYLVKLIFT